MTIVSGDPRRRVEGENTRLRHDLDRCTPFACHFYLDNSYIWDLSPSPKRYWTFTPIDILGYLYLQASRLPIPVR